MLAGLCWLIRSSLRSCDGCVYFCLLFTRNSSLVRGSSDHIFILLLQPMWLSSVKQETYLNPNPIPNPFHLSFSLRRLLWILDHAVTNSYDILSPVKHKKEGMLLNVGTDSLSHRSLSLHLLFIPRKWKVTETVILQSMSFCVPQLETQLCRFVMTWGRADNGVKF